MFRNGLDMELIPVLREGFKGGKSIQELMVDILKWNSYDEYESVMLGAYFRQAFCLTIRESGVAIGARLPWSGAKVDYDALLRGDFGDFTDLKALIESRRSKWEFDGADCT